MTETVVSPYQGYVYAYPHKTAYRPLPDRPLLRRLWTPEPQHALALYVHIPFCGVRCGFCNLFTRVGNPDGLTTAYLDAVQRQGRAVRDALADDARFALAAFGGGTPTYLTAAELSRLCDITEQVMGADLRAIPLSVEASPDTTTTDRLAVLADRGATRISLGVQSFRDDEAQAAVRPQKRAAVEAALDRIRATGFPVLNIDLIYGIDGQSETNWLSSLETALAWRPEELYLYPLYVRPLTGLGRRAAACDSPAWDAQRLALYRAGRDYLSANGYHQVSMRMFRRIGAAGARAGEYACQNDGMVGLGCGARSYTSRLHYSFDYAVDAREVRAIIDDYVAATDFSRAVVGWEMAADESRRRYLIQSLLQADGFAKADYLARFGTEPAHDFPAELAEFVERGWLVDDHATLRLTTEGLAYSDAIGPRLFSPTVRTSMAEYELR